MNLSNEHALELIDNKKFISYKLQLFDDTNQVYYGCYLDKKQVDDFSHQFITVTHYDTSTSSNKNHVYMHNYNYS